jgi:hypothetical protein
MPGKAAGASSCRFPAHFPRLRGEGRAPAKGLVFVMVSLTFCVVAVSVCSIYVLKSPLVKVTIYCLLGKLEVIVLFSDKPYQPIAFRLQTLDGHSYL